MKSVKQLVFLALVTICCSKVAAQYSLGVNYSPLFPVTAYSSDLKTSFIGANARFKYGVDELLHLTAGVGYQRYTYKNLNIDGVLTPVDDVHLSIIPVTLGAEFFFTTDKYRPFISIELGYAMTMQNESDLMPATTRHNFIIAPAAGVAYEFTEKVFLTAAVRNNIIVYEFKDQDNYNQPFQSIALELGATYKF